MALPQTVGNNYRAETHCEWIKCSAWSNNKDLCMRIPVNISYCCRPCSTGRVRSYTVMSIVINSSKKDDIKEADQRIKGGATLDEFLLVSPLRRMLYQQICHRCEHSPAFGSWCHCHTRHWDSADKCSSLRRNKTYSNFFSGRFKTIPCNKNLLSSINCRGQV